MPYHINFAITFKCNASCRHCSIDADDMKSSQHREELSRDELFKVLQQIADIGVHLLALCGGEPILHPDIYDIIRFCKENDLFVALATNGLAINEEVVDKLYECGLDGVLVSLDHTDKAMHNLVRGNELAFDSAVNSIKLFNAKKIFTTVGITPIKTNYNNIFDIVNLAVNMGAQAVNLSSYVPTGRGTDELDLTPKQWKDLIIKWFKTTKELDGTIRLQMHDPRIHVLSKDSLSSLGSTGCLAGSLHCYILPDGAVNPCVMLPIDIGNVKEKHLRDIIFEYQLGEDNLLNRSKLKGKCGECGFKHKCGGCRAVAYSYTGDVHEADPHCWIETSRKGVGEVLES